MKLTEMFLNFLDKIGRKRIVLDRESQEPYLERYYIFLKDRKNFPFNVFIHKFLKSDPDDVHDHPWPYFTIILKGGYWEWIPQFDQNGKMTCEIGKWRKPGHFRFCKANSFHRIELDPSVTCWTMFFPGPQKREWGFLMNKNKKHVWVHNEEYLNERLLNAKKKS